MRWIGFLLRLPRFVIERRCIERDYAARDARGPMIWLIVVEDRPRWGKPSAAIEGPALAGYLKTHQRLRSLIRAFSSRRFLRRLSL
jgi:hypothetical protein